MKLKMTRMLLLALLVCLAAFVAGCDDRGADEGPGFNNGSNPDGPNDPNGPNDPDGPDFCEDPTQLFTIDFIRPADGETNVSIGTDIIVNFSHEPEAASIGRSLSAGLITLTASGGQSVKLDYSVESDTAFFTAVTPSPLSQSTTYTFTIENVPQASAVQAEECANTGGDAKYLTITDGEGNPIDEKDVTFTTGMVNDFAIVDTDPADGGAAGPEVTPAVTFNQEVLSPVVCNGANAAITLVNTNGTAADTSDDIAVAGDCGVSTGGNVVTFTPENPLVVNEDYQLTVKADGVQPKNALANPLTTDEVIDFSVSDILDPTDCTAPAAGICVLDSSGGGLVNVLLNGPLAPIADNLGGKDELVTVLTNLLENDDGSLGSIVKGLIQDGQLQEALKTLLLDEQNGLRTILPELLTGLPDLLTDGVGGLVEALATGTDTSACDAAVGTVCLVGSGDTVGVLDLLIGDDGYLNSVGLSQQQLVDVLGNTLESGDGSLQGLVQGLFQEGQLQAGLKALLIGNEDTGGSPGLLNALQSVGANLASGLVNTLATLLGVDPGSVGNLGDLLGSLPLLGDALGGLGDLVDQIPGLGDILGPLLP